MAYDPIHYPIGDIFSPYKEILSCNNGHRNIPAWAVPDSEVPLICSEQEWEQIQRQEFEKVYPKNMYCRGPGLSVAFYRWCLAAVRSGFCPVRQ